MVKLFSEVLGREVEVPDKPERIVSLAPAITEALYLLGAWDRVVGVSHFCHKPKEALEKPRLGSYFQVNYKKLDELRPDLVLVTTGAQRKLALEMAEKGYPVYPIPLPLSLAGVIDMAYTVGLVIGELEAARKLENELAAKLARIPRLEEPMRAYYEIDLGGPVSAGGLSYITDALSRIGLDTPFSGERVTWVINPDPKVIIDFDPEVILYEKAPYKKYDEQKILGDLTSRGLDKTTAFREGRIIMLEPDSLAHYGPSLLDVMETIISKIQDNIL